jgi:cell division protein FtsB
MIPCKKVSYSTKEFADADLKRIAEKNEGKNYQVPVKSYKCEKCNTWHITKNQIGLLQDSNKKLRKENETLIAENKYLASVRNDLTWFKKYERLDRAYQLLLKGSKATTIKDLRQKIEKLKKDNAYLINELYKLKQNDK